MVKFLFMVAFMAFSCIANADEITLKSEKSSFTYSCEQFFALKESPIKPLEMISMSVIGDPNKPFNIDNEFENHFENLCLNSEGYLQPPTYLSSVHFENCSFVGDNYGPNVSRFTQNATSLSMISCGLTEKMVGQLRFSVSPYLLGEVDFSDNLLGNNPEELKEVLKEYNDSEFRFTVNLSGNPVEESLLKPLNDVCKGLTIVKE